MKKIIGYTAIAAVLAFTLFLILKIPGQTKPRTGPRMTDSLATLNVEWLGIFIKGVRVGYSFTKVTDTEHGLVVENRTQMTLLIMNERRTLMTHLYAHTDKDYTLNRFSMDLNTTGHLTRVEGNIDGTILELTTLSQGQTNTQTITLKEKPYFPEALEEVIKKRKLNPGDEITLPYFDPTTQSSAEARIKVLEQEKVWVNDREFTGMRIEIDYMGINSVWWLDSDYRLIKEATPALGMEMIPLSKDEALAEIETKEAFDLLSFFAVHPDNFMPDPTRLRYLELQLDDISPTDLDLGDDFQVLLSKEPIVIGLSRPDLAALPELTVPIAGHQEFLEPSVYIQSRDPEIVALARKFAGAEKDARKIVGHLVDGVYNYIEKKPTASLPSALDVLRTREGDCNEHAVFFTALARALGIPAKIYVGLIYLQGHAYYYHAWCAVWIGKWVPVDPTFNQFPADLGHLKLKEGELAEQAKVLKVVGRLGIRVRNFTEE